MGAILVLFMHAGFAFLEVGTVRHKNQVNALVKILTDFGASAVAYFAVGYSIAYGSNFFGGADTLVANSGYELTKFFFLLTFAAAIPAIISGGIAERAAFWPMMMANVTIVALIYPLFEGMIWNGNFGFQAGWNQALARVSMTLRALLWCTVSVVGWRWPLYCCWAHAMDGSVTDALSVSLHLASLSWRWVHGS